MCSLGAGENFTIGKKVKHLVQYPHHTNEETASREVRWAAQDSPMTSPGPGQKAALDAHAGLLPFHPQHRAYTRMSSKSEVFSLQKPWLCPAFQYKTQQDPLTPAKFKHFHLLRSIMKEKPLTLTALGKDG